MGGHGGGGEEGGREGGSEGEGEGEAHRSRREPGEAAPNPLHLRTSSCVMRIRLSSSTRALILEFSSSVALRRLLALLRPTSMWFIFEGHHRGVVPRGWVRGGGISALPFFLVG